MKDIKNFINEKLVINRDSQVSSQEDINNPEFYRTCQIPEIDKEIQNFLDKNNQLSFPHGYLPKKIRNTKNINSSFYKIYSYLYFHGPTSKKEVLSFFGHTGSFSYQWAEWSKLNIINSDRGMVTCNNPSKWKRI